MGEGRVPGPLEAGTLALLGPALERLAEGFAGLPEAAGEDLDPADLARVLAEVADRLKDNYPYFHPMYAGQMLKPPHPAARLAYALAQFVNPNNHALDGGRASSAMEKEAVADLARMAGFATHLGHLCGGGTMANLEALWVAGRLAPGRAVLASAQAHYTHRRIGAVLGLAVEEVPCDGAGRMDLAALRGRLARGDVGTVVATAGTTATGAVDPVHEIAGLREGHPFRLHVDAAYGGYFRLAGNLAPGTRAALDALGQADSMAIDPHKHGMQPYGCGCVLFRDPGVGALYRHDSPYTYFTSADLHLGEISLECSRPGAAAVALWATHRLLPPVPGGAFAARLEAGREAALHVHRRLREDPRFAVAGEPELDIVAWAVRSPDAATASRRAREVFRAAAGRGLHLALADLPAAFLAREAPALAAAGGTVTCLRSVLMKPQHREWADRILGVLSEATAEVLGPDGA